ncbi:MAG: protein phosphatase 2C domain-containing protein [Deltaproteobacteria bacterium]|nr:protein phosphatase 2C domain-containing protein [Deltaproteobacteria bacterium]
MNHHALTDVGCRRDQNEDSYFCDPSHGLFLVADGVGGRAAGEVASQIATDTFAEAGPHLHATLGTFLDNPSLARRNEVLESLDAVFQLASRRVYEAAERRDLRGMTTTLAVVLVGGGWAFVAHVGDSRVWLLRDGSLSQLTEDHTMVNELVRNAQLTREEAAHTTYRNVITRAVGLHPTVQPDTLAVELWPGDRLLLNSDGLSDVVSKEDLARLGSLEDIEEATGRLLAEALDAEAPDNVTIVLVEPEPSPKSALAIARAQAMDELFLFRGLPFHARLRVSRICDEQFFAPDEVVVSQSDPGLAMYVVIQGELLVSRGGVELARLGPGDHFGEIALADGLPRSATVTGLTFGSLIIIHQANLVEFTRREPELGNEILWRLLQALAGRLRETNARLTSGGLA